MGKGEKEEKNIEGLRSGVQSQQMVEELLRSLLSGHLHLWEGDTSSTSLSLMLGLRWDATETVALTL